MKKLKMSATKTMTFEEGCNKYLENCRQRNLREGTIRHYRQSYGYFYKYFNPNMPISDIDSNTYKDYVLYLKSTLHILLGIITQNAWWYGIAATCWAFWLAPFTPFLPLCIALTFAIRKIFNTIKNKRKSRSE